MEGYVGGGILTVMLGLGFIRLCIEYGYPSLICPAEANHEYIANMLSIDNETLNVTQSLLYTPQCQIPDVFLPQYYQVKLLKILGK